MALPRLARTLVCFGCLAITCSGASSAAKTFRVASFNVENYLEGPSGTRPAKSPEAKAKVRESLRALQADVISLQEMGDTNALLELRASLKAEGDDFPYWEHLTGHDTNIHLAILSKFPITARRPHLRDSFLLFGRRFPVSRGFIEVDIQAAPDFSFTLLAAHLKSRLPVPEADEGEMREQESLLLREKINLRLKANPDANLIVLGDFNDTKDSKSIRTLLGRGRTALIDTRPGERNSDGPASANRRLAARDVTWTYYYSKEDAYTRIDYILISPSLAKKWNKTETCVLALPDWGVASDHRPIVAGFDVENAK